MNRHLLLDDTYMVTLFARTFLHPELKGRIDMVPTSWLLSLANPTPSEKTDLGNWAVSDELVDFDALQRNIELHGMRDPFIIGVGQFSRKIRLEAGNHRVRSMLKHGVLLVPATAYVGEVAITHEGNGLHEGQEAELLIPPTSGLLGPYPEKRYARPSDVIAGCPGLRFDGWPA